MGRPEIRLFKEPSENQNELVEFINRLLKEGDKNLYQISKEYAKEKKEYGGRNGGENLKVINKYNKKIMRVLKTMNLHSEKLKKGGKESVYYSLKKPSNMLCEKDVENNIAKILPQTLKKIEFLKKFYHLENSVINIQSEITFTSDLTNNLLRLHHEEVDTHFCKDCDLETKKICNNTQKWFEKQFGEYIYSLLIPRIENMIRFELKKLKEVDKKTSDKQTSEDINQDIKEYKKFLESIKNMDYLPFFWSTRIPSALNLLYHENQTRVKNINKKKVVKKNERKRI
jgi:ubiquinone/menaquinone biosynthesis C-methylase UbiE